MRNAAYLLYAVVLNGIIRVFRNGSLAAQPFLDIRSKTRASGEQGLLGLAFPRDSPKNTDSTRTMTTSAETP